MSYSHGFGVALVVAFLTFLYMTGYFASPMFLFNLLAALVFIALVLAINVWESRHNK